MTLFENPTLRFYAPKLAFIIGLPILVLLVRVVTNEGQWIWHPDMPIVLSLTALLACTFWSAKGWASPKGQPWPYKLLFALNTGFWFGALMYLISFDDTLSGTAHLIKFVTHSLLFGGLMAAIARADTLEKPLPTPRQMGQAFPFLIGAYVLFALSLSRDEPYWIGALIGINTIQLLGYPEMPTFKEPEGKLRFCIVMLILCFAGYLALMGS